MKTQDSALKTNSEWWRGAVIYEVYVRSFLDSNGDGEGDLRGVIEGLSYLERLGVDAIWLTPISPSPNFDSGYDVSDYYGIAPKLGEMADFKHLVADAHERGIRVILDQVYSHSSHLHPWFKESASSRDNPKADWYVWSDPKPDGGPPNNWLGRFGGYAWEWSPVRKQYYLHNFLTEQPDLNLHNAEVRGEILKIMRHWFDLGVDGLRLDVVNFLMHDPELRDNPPAAQEGATNPYYMQAHVYDRSRPENLPFLRQMRDVADQVGDRMLLGEISCDQQVERMAEYTGPGLLHTAYSFELLGQKLNGGHIADAITRAGANGAWPCWAFSNHDVVRVASRWGVTGCVDRIKLLQALLLCLRGTVCLFQGEELGLPHADVPRHHLQDPEAIRFWPNHRGRDGARTPMPWTNEGESLGFSECVGWLPADAAHGPLAISEQEAKEGSILNHARALIQVRKQSAAIRLGSWEVLGADDEWLIFRRVFAEETLVCGFNWGKVPISFECAGKCLAGRVDSGVIHQDQYAIMRVET